MATKDKKWIQKAINPAHKGRCKDMGSASCPVGSPQYNLAKTFKKMGERKATLKKHHGSSKK